MERNPRSNYIYLSVSLLALLYAVIRAFRVNITYDESCTIMDAVPQSTMQILTFSYSNANNHLLNTLLIKLFFVFGNQHLFLARLPNVLAFLAYLFFAYKITTNFLAPRFAFLTFLLLILNPFSLDFFSLARGYGISLGCQMGAIYYALVFLKEKQTPFVLSASLGWAALSVLANFSALNFLLSIAAILAIYLVVHKMEQRGKNAISFVGIICLLALIIFEPIKKLKSSGYFWYGGNTGFYEDTLVSLTKYTFYNEQASTAAIFSLNLFLFLFIAITLVGLYFNRTFFSLKNILLFVLSLSILSVIAQHYLMANLYITDRSSLFLYPLIMLSLGFSIESIEYKKMMFVIYVTLITAFTVNFFMRANFYKTAIWFFDAHTLEILTKINSEGQKKNIKYKVDYSGLFDSAAWYYLNTENFECVERVEGQTSDLKLPFDYYIFLSTDLEKVGYVHSTEAITNLSKDTVLSFPKEHVYVFKAIP